MLHFPRWQVVFVVLVVLTGILAVLPNIVPRSWLAPLPGWWPKQEIVLGLDLQGGAYLLYEVDREEYVERRLRSLTAEVRDALRDEPRIGYTGLGVVDGGVQVRIRDSAQFDEAQERLADLTNPLASGLFGQGGTEEFQLTEGSNNVLRLEFTSEGLAARVRSIVDQSIEVVRRRIDELGTTEPSIQREGEGRILVEAPGGDPEQLKALVGTTAALTFHLVDTSVSGEEAMRTRPPPGTMVLLTSEEDPLERMRPYVLAEEPLLTGEDLVDAQPGFEQQTNEPMVTFRLTTAGGRKFGQVTSQNVGRPFAIVLDDEVISAPVITRAHHGRWPARSPGSSRRVAGGDTNLAILLAPLAPLSLPASPSWRSDDGGRGPRRRLHRRGASAAANFSLNRGGDPRRRVDGGPSTACSGIFRQHLALRREHRPSSSVTPLSLLAATPDAAGASRASF